MTSYKKSFVWFIVLTFLSLFHVSVEGGKGRKCPGKCIANVTDCRVKGGKIAGYCTNELPCCDYTYIKIGSCGAKKSKLNTAIFRSPDFPDFSQGDLTCPFEFALSPNASGITIEFTHVTLDGVGFVKDSPCESDMFYFKGFPDWTPPAQCGNLTNYVATIDLGNNLTKGMKSLTILAIMSSRKYRWNIKVSQVNLKAAKQPTSTTTVSSIQSTDNSLDDVEEFPGDQEKMVIPPDEDVEDGALDLIDRIPPVTRAYHRESGRSMSPTEWFWSDDDTETDLEEETFIVNGQVTKVSSTPWQASLRSNVGPNMAKLLPKYKLKNCTLTEGIHFCGGTVVSSRHIISAAHCFYMGEKYKTWQNLQNMKIVLGDSNLCDESTDGVQEFRVDKVYYHYAYDHKVIMHDLVVIKLDKEIEFSDKVKVVKMAGEGMTYTHVEALASGWGLTNLTIGTEAKTPDDLRSAENMFIGNSSECIAQQRKLYPTLSDIQIKKFAKYKDVFDSLLCTYVRNGSVPSMVGQGDSGGPLVIKSATKVEEGNKETEPLLVGVISYMIPITNEEEAHDVSSYVDFYQSVSFYRKWIDVAMHQR